LLLARDAATGAEIWTKAMPTDHPRSKPTIANGLVYLGAGSGHVYAVDADTGATKWIGSSPSTLGVFAEPTVVNGWVYFTSMGYDIDAYSLP
jgi:outer membrane protein assembly factor BamB